MVSVASRFQPYTAKPSIVPLSIWRVGRLAALLATVGLAIFIWRDPPRGLMLFWQLLMPGLVLVFAAAPGLWRQLCPMAFLNQLPVETGWSLGRAVSPVLLARAALIATLAFVAIIVLKRPLLVQSAGWTCAGIAAGLLLALAGGVLFRGRSGWCGTFCPLGPIQKLYGHAPPVTPSNGYCRPCVGCQQNCYDFNPMAAIHADLEDARSRSSTYRTLFAALLPGLILGGWLADPYGIRGTAQYLTEFAAYLVGSAGIFLILGGIFRVSQYKLTAIFGMAAFVIFFWFESAAMVGAFGNLTGVLLPYPAASYVIVAVATLVAGQIMVIGLRNERAYGAERQALQEPRIGIESAAIETGRQLAATVVIRDRASGRTFGVDPDKSLLDALETAGLSVPFGCRSGICGADPIMVVEGGQNLSPPTPDELATLRRLGLEGRARLACACRAKGPIEIDLAALQQAVPSAAAPAGALVTADLAAAAGIGRVVILGNGVAGMTAADLIRNHSPSCRIDVIARENHHFYNRMALGRIMHSRSGLEGLHLAPAVRLDARQIRVWLNTLAVRIDPDRHVVRLGTGEVLPYDRLILAQGAQAIVPDVPGRTLQGAFVLREADDALRIRSWSQAAGCIEAAVVGGGVLGVEAAAALNALGLRVTLLHQNTQLMDRQLDARGAAILARFLAGTGIEVLCGVEATHVTGDRTVTGVRLANGETIPAQLCLFCVGVRPETELATAAGIATDRGILVNDRMETSVDDILAIGDVAQHPGTTTGLWTASARQAEVAVGGMLGKTVESAAQETSVQLKVPGIDAYSFGIVDAQGPGDTEVNDPEADENEHRKLIVRDGRLVGAVSVGPPGTAGWFRALTAQGGDSAHLRAALERGEWPGAGAFAQPAAQADGPPAVAAVANAVA